jgi:hypothetical protein
VLLSLMNYQPLGASLTTLLSLLLVCVGTAGGAGAVGAVCDSGVFGDAGAGGAGAAYGAAGAAAAEIAAVDAGSDRALINVCVTALAGAISTIADAVFGLSTVTCVSCWQGYFET